MHYYLNNTKIQYNCVLSTRLQHQKGDPTPYEYSYLSCFPISDYKIWPYNLLVNHICFIYSRSFIEQALQYECSSQLILEASNDKFSHLNIYI